LPDTPQGWELYDGRLELQAEELALMEEADLKKINLTSLGVLAPAGAKNSGAEMCDSQEHQIYAGNKP